MRSAFGVLAIGTFCAGCATVPPSGSAAVADLKAASGSSVAGTVTFTQTGNRVVVVARVSGLTPGDHGFHIHEKGDCGAPDAMSAGGHFNPLGKSHAHPTTADRHAGDMPMLTADAAGNAALSADLDVIAVGGGATDIVGKSVVVHKDPDDFKTQPTGNSGARVACGVIRKA